ncbi:RusA family crossover junction endodeoxyribonuclease [Cupriavidus sp. AcVe19-6a]|uniref:RusA family crossover junction endodeoxyribonuclease n=1 Tax=Cupriavidus sp. AcVe19-6a TaxID=2821358 RepID=UPI001AE30026|nr:RusA family crossover junction endodeoxyribonuclease [Cupriavidus sp. AcVe19-6a]MBP0634886.1 RusA family crossover junction endodeoxyribonuclease [Cupriavidus sp. AcVe19-6a]
MDAQAGFEIVLPYPPSTNELWEPDVVRSHAGRPIGAMRLTAKARKYKTDVGWLLKKAGVRKPITGRVAIEGTLHPKLPLDARERMRKFGDAWEDSVRCIDIDNARKVVFDALKGIAFVDDRFVWDDHFRRGEPLATPCLRIRIRAIPYHIPQMELL